MAFGPKGVFMERGGREVKVTCQNLEEFARGDPYLTTGAMVAKAVLRKRKGGLPGVPSLPPELAQRTNSYAFDRWWHEFAFDFARGPGTGESHGSWELQKACPRAVEKAQKLRRTFG